MKKKQLKALRKLAVAARDAAEFAAIAPNAMLMLINKVERQRAALSAWEGGQGMDGEIIHMIGEALGEPETAPMFYNDRIRRMKHEIEQLKKQLATPENSNER